MSTLLMSSLGKWKKKICCENVDAQMQLIIILKKTTTANCKIQSMSAKLLIQIPNDIDKVKKK